MNNKDGLAAKQRPGFDLGGLGDLASMLESPVAEFGRPRMFDLNLIDEDPDNQRQSDNPGFSNESLAELAATMGNGRGVKSPLSLRPNAHAPGRFYINHGHRRYRAARIAGLTHVPGFLDEHFDKYDQMIENIQRENLTARETADFVGSELAQGKTLTEIARLLGKSKAFVSQHTTLLSLPDPVADAFHSGQIKDLTLVNELVRAHKENPRAVEDSLAAGEGSLAAKPLTREAVKAMRVPAAKQATQPAVLTHMQRMENDLTERLATTVNVRHCKKGRQVQLIIHARDWGHLNDLLTRLGLSKPVGGTVLQLNASSEEVI